MSVKNFRRAAALCAALWIALSACSASATVFESPPIDRRISKNEARSLDDMPDTARARADELVVGVTELTGEINPFFARTSGDSSVATLLFDELLFTNNAGEAGPGVATYTLSATGAEVTFTIRENVRYIDGEPVTSDDFINALYLLINPAYDGAYDISPLGIAGRKEYQSGGAAEVRGIVRVNDRTFTVALETPISDQLVFFAIPALRVSLAGDMKIPATATDAAARAAAFANAVKAARAVDAPAMAYGQYTLVLLEEGVHALFTKNQAYWRGAPKIGTLRLQVVSTDTEEVFSMMLAGSVDIVNLIGSIEIVNRAYDARFINLYTWESDIIGYLGMDLDNALFMDTAVRHALAVGLNREQACDSVFERYASVPKMILFDAFGISREMNEELYPYNPEYALELFESAGWVMGDDGLLHRGDKTFTFALTFNTPNPYMDKVATQMHADYRRIGVDVKLNPVTLGELAAGIEQDNLAMYFEARRLPVDPALAANLFVGDSHLNAGGYRSDTTDRLLRIASMEKDPARRNVYYEVLFQQLYADLPFIPLYRRSDMLLINGRVMNANVTTAHDILSDAYRFFLVDTLEGQW